MLHPGAEVASERAGLESRVSALTREISDERGKGVEARISEDSHYGRSRLEGRSTFHLDARDPRSEPAAQAAARTGMSNSNRVPRFGSLRTVMRLP